MKPERAVVLAAGAAGLRTSAWLARRGVAVRHLGIADGGDEEPAWPNAIHGDRAILEDWFGPGIEVRCTRGFAGRDGIRKWPTRRRDLARLCGASSLGVIRDLRPRARSPRTLDAWGSRHFGSAAYRQLLRPLFAKRLGASPAELPASIGALLIGSPDDVWWSRAADREQAASDAAEIVLDAGGEVLSDVEALGVEVEEGRVSAIMTEFGRERVPDRLYTDLSPRALTQLLPPDALAAADRTAIAALTVQTRSHLQLRADATGAPWQIWVGGSNVPVLQTLRSFGRPGEPRPDRLDVETLHPPSDEGAIDRAVATVSSWIPVKGMVGSTRQVVPVPPTPAGASALARLWALGVIPVGAAALHLPIGPGWEARLATQWQHRSDPIADLLITPESVRGLTWLP